MPNLSIVLVYQPPSGRPFCISQLDQPTLITEVAQAALAECEDRAQAMIVVDPILASVQRAEAGRLRQVLGLFLPELRSKPSRVWPSASVTGEK